MTKKKIETIQSTELKHKGGNLGLRLLKNHRGRFEIALIVNEHTTQKDIEKEWNSIKALANKVLEFQGTDPNDFSFISRLSYTKMKHLEGFSYLEVAMDANFDTLCNLVDAIKYKKSGNMRSAYEMLYFAIDRLKGFGFKHEDALDVIVDSVLELEKGIVPWNLTTGPVTKQRVVDFIRQIDREQKSRKIVIKKKPIGVNTKKISVKELLDKNSDTAEQVENMLKKFPDSGGLTKLKAAHERYLNTLLGLENVE